jgi:hypothetical protein
LTQFLRQTKSKDLRFPSSGINLIKPMAHPSLIRFWALAASPKFCIGIWPIAARNHFSKVDLALLNEDN